MTNYIIEFPGLGLTLNPPAGFSIGSFEIRFYGLIIALGLVLAVVYALRRKEQFGLSEDDLMDGVLWIVPFAILCARLYYCVFEWDSYKDNPLSILYIWEGGLAIYGGVIGAFVTGFIMCKVRKVKFTDMFDIAALGFLIGQGIGRWGNFTNQEAFGVNTTSLFGMTSDKIAEYINGHQQEFAQNGIEMNPDLPVHPTFLYESVWCILGFVVLFIVCQKFYKFDGQLILGYGIIYGLERTVVEGLRIDSLYIGNTNLRVSQLVSLALVIICTAITIYKFVKLKKEKKLSEVQENV